MFLENTEKMDIKRNEYCNKPDFLSNDTSTHYSYLSHDVAVIQWITSCHKNCMTTRVITLWREHVTSLTASVSTMRFLIEIMFNLKAIKSHF